MRAELEASRAAFGSVLSWPVRDSVYRDAAGTTFERSSYVVFFPRKPAPESERYSRVADSLSRFDHDVAFKLVSVTSSGVVEALGLLAGLDGRVLDIPGRACSALRVESEPVLHDPTAGGLFYADGWVRFTSRPG